MLMPPTPAAAFVAPGIPNQPMAVFLYIYIYIYIYTRIFGPRSARPQFYIAYGSYGRINGCKILGRT